MAKKSFSFSLNPHSEFIPEFLQRVLIGEGSFGSLFREIAPTLSFVMGLQPHKAASATIKPKGSGRRGTCM
jgi:hypothetical protein